MGSRARTAGAASPAKSRPGGTPVAASSRALLIVPERTKSQLRRGCRKPGPATSFVAFPKSRVCFEPEEDNEPLTRHTLNCTFPLNAEWIKLTGPWKDWGKKKNKSRS